MRKGKKDDANAFEIKEIIDIVSESDTSDWCKAVARISWNGQPATLDFRRLNMSKLEIFPKGIGFTDEEADRLTNILLNLDFGDMDALKAAIKRRESRFTITENDLPSYPDEDDCFVVKFNI